MNTDPSQYPDENPLAQKQGGSAPTAQEVQDYGDGLIAPTSDAFSDSYTYRGADESVLHQSGKSSVPIHLGTSPRYHRK